MQFLNPWWALATAAASIPLLLLLYFLKLRRERVVVPSTLLWIKSFEDLQVNAPFQRLRWSWLLLLHLLLLLSILAAVSRPVIEGDLAPSSRVILLIDVSASMKTADTNDAEMPTRFARAQAAAIDFVESMRSGNTTATDVMIATFGATPTVVTGFESSPDRLIDVLSTLTPTDEEADLGSALQLAGAFASGGDTERGIDEAPPVVLLITDGGVAPPKESSGHALRAGAIQVIDVGPEPDATINNVGISAFSAQRPYDDPTTVRAFVRAVNAGASSVDVVMTVTPADGASQVKRVSIPAADEGGPGERSLTFSFDAPETTLLTVRHLHEDDFPDDDVAAIVVPAPLRPSVLVVYPDSGSEGEGADGDDDASGPLEELVSLLRASEPAALRVMSESAFASIDLAALDAGELADLVVFDRVDPLRLTGVPSLTVGGLPTGFTMLEGDLSAGRRLLSWDRQHPVMRYLNLDVLVMTGFTGMTVPTGSDVLASTEQGAAIATLRVRGAPHVVVGFSGLDERSSNWSLDVSVTIFLENVFDYLGVSSVGGVVQGQRPGSVITVRPLRGASSVRVSVPGGDSVEVPAEGRTTVALPRQSQAGVYSVERASVEGNVLALSVLSDVESDVRPRPALRVNASTTSQVAEGRTAPYELWPWLILFAMATLIAEWLVYCWKLSGPLGSRGGAEIV